VPVLVVGAVVLVVVAILAGVLLYGAFSDRAAGGGRHTLSHPVGLRPVAAVYDGPCRSGDLAGGGECYRLGGGMTLAAVDDISVDSGSNGDSVVTLSLRSADRKRFTHLTERLSAQSPPHNRLAIVVRGRVVSAPAVVQTITGGQVQIAGNYTEDEAQRLVDRITG
jgi:hypothetical protein